MYVCLLNFKGTRAQTHKQIKNDDTTDSILESKDQDFVNDVISVSIKNKIQDNSKKFQFRATTEGLNRW